MLQGSPEETRRLYDAWAHQSQRNKQNKMKFQLSYEFSNKIQKKSLTLDWNRILSFDSTAERNIQLI